MFLQHEIYDIVYEHLRPTNLSALLDSELFLFLFLDSATQENNRAAGLRFFARQTTQRTNKQSTKQRRPEFGQF